MDQSAFKRRIMPIAGVLLLCGIAYWLAPIWFAPGNLREFCPTLHMGMTMDQIGQWTKIHRFKLNRDLVTPNRAYIWDSRSMARYTCELTFNSEGLVSSKYVVQE